MEHALAAAGETGEPVGLFFVDLDGFKSVNDELGQLGGDEFAIVLSGVTSQPVVEAAADRVRRAFDEPFEVGGERLRLGASVGLAIWPEDAHEIEALMRHADAAMYREKRAARAR
jgi:diguanylate cyclase (GGDEF)-like protein